MTMADILVPYALLGVIAATVSYYLASRPRAAFTFWLTVTVLAPFWMRLDLGPLALNPPTAAAIVCLPAMIVARKDRLSTADGILFALLITTLIGNSVFYSPDYAMKQIVLQWLTAYLIGRNLGYAAGSRYVSRVIVVLSTIVGAWAVLEFAVDWHVFQNFGTSQPEGFWADIQERSGYVRSEAAFGHPIALGGFLSASIPFIATAAISVWTRSVCLIIVCCATAATISRAPLIAAFVGLMLVAAFMPASSFGRGKQATVGAGVIIAGIAAPIVLSTLGRATDTESSSQYRVNLWAEIPGDTNLIGLGNNITVNSLGNPIWRDLDSVDSTPLLIGLNFGWVAVALLGGLLVCAIIRTVQRRASVAEIALVAQIPVLLTVALITQYTAIVWLMVGLAVAFRNDSTSLDQRRSLEMIRPDSMQRLSGRTEGTIGTHYARAGENG